MDTIFDFLNYINYYNDNMNKSNNNNNKNIYTDNFITIGQNEINNLRGKFKILDVDYLDPILVNSKMFGDKYFESNPTKKQIIQEMLDYYLLHKDKPIYKKTDYLCNEKEQICICNTHAHDLRKIYDGINYKPKHNFISWIKKTNEPF